MQVEILHRTEGDRSKEFDTETEHGRQQAAILLNRLMKEGTAIFLERETKSGKNRTYKVDRYDPEKDMLIVNTELHGESKTVATKGRKAKTTAVAPSAGG